MPFRTWRKNGQKLNRRKAIRAEVHRRLDLNRNDENAWEMYHWVQGKIRRFYDIAPLSVVWPNVHAKVLRKP
jgi:hypothetical protein